jgi:hypothetical protein
VTINNLFDVSKKFDSRTGIFQGVEIWMGSESGRQRVDAEIWDDGSGVVAAAE